MDSYMKTARKGSRLRSGRKHAEDSRASEFCLRLTDWKQTPESSRPSLRALARELGTSHQLLNFYLKNLDKWQTKQYFRQADKIRALTVAESRSLTEREEQLFHAYIRAAIRAMADPVSRNTIEQIKQASERRPLNWYEVKMLNILAPQFSEAQELFQRCSQDGPPKRKRFAELVRETPRQEGETFTAWVRRIWDRCEEYATKCPTVLTEELLEKYSRSGTTNQRNNLPLIPTSAAKPFRTA